MFSCDNASQKFVTTQGLYCVWIRANETPGAPLIAVWVDPKMRSFESAVNVGAAPATAPSMEEETSEPVDH